MMLLEGAYVKTRMLFYTFSVVILPGLPLKAFCTSPGFALDHCSDHL